MLYWLSIELVVMKAAIVAFAQKVFDIREGEFSRVIRMQLNFFLVIATLLIVKPTVNGLFLAEMGASGLPYAYLLVAVFAILVTSIYARILGRVNLNRIILGTLLFSAGLFILFGILLQLKIVVGWILYAFYIVVAIFAVLSASQFWVLANVIFNAREAKRIFGFVGAGAIAGGIVGGYITTLLAGPLGSENLIFIAAGILLLCVPNTAYMWKHYVVTAQSKYQRRKKIPRIDHPFFLIRKSSHLTNLSGIIAISVIVAKLVDYQFGAITSGIIQDPDELTAFFGFWFSNFNVLSLIIQLILTRRIVRKLGIGGSLFLLPAGIFLGASLVLFMPLLWTAVFLKSSDASLKQSLNRATFELLAVPIPSEIKNQTKIFIDVVVDSLATGAGGIILIFVINGLNLSTGSVSIIILLLLGLWFTFIRRVQRTYIDAFKVNLKDLSEEEARVVHLEHEEKVTNLKNALRNGSERQILSVLQKLKIQPDTRYLRELEDLLNHSSGAIQEETIRNLYYIHIVDYSKQITSFIRSESEAVRVAAFSYLIARAGRNAPVFIRQYLEMQDDALTLPLLISLAEESRDNPVLKENFQLASRLTSEFDRLPLKTPEPVRKSYTISLLKATGLSKISLLFPKIERFMTDPDFDIRSQAILSAGETLDPYFIPALIELLGESHSGEVAESALSNYGNEIIPVIIRYMKSARVSVDIIRRLPSVIENFPVQAAVDFLMILATDDDNQTSLSALDRLLHLRRQRPSMNYYKKKCQIVYRNELALLQSLINCEYVLQRNIEMSGPDLLETTRSLFSIQLTELVDPLKKISAEKAGRWLRLLSALPKTKSPVTSEPIVKMNREKNQGNQISELPDSVEKQRMLWLLRLLEKDRITLEDLAKLGNVVLPNFEEAILFVGKLNDRTKLFCQELEAILGVKN